MDAWPMLRRCWLAQWRGFTWEEQDYMIQESERGYPTGLSLGHSEYILWSIERYKIGSSFRLGARTADHLLFIKVDCWPETT